MKELLEMIETVDPADTEKLDEIDARVCCYLSGKTYKSHNRNESLSDPWLGWLVTSTVEDESKYISFHSSYTRSRDALKAIRPEGWFIHLEPVSSPDFEGRGILYKCHCSHYGERYINTKRTKTPVTECLAELHAIIQAIGHEREKTSCTPI